MSISLNPLSANLNEVSLNGWTLLFSYKTLVAIRNEHGSYQTATKYSNTTSRHITMAGFKAAQKIDQSTLEAMAAGICVPA